MNRTTVYLDSSIITTWIITEDVPENIEKLPLRARKCMKLLDYIVDGKFDCNFQTSDWAISEMIQSIRDRSIFWKFFHDGYEFASFSRMKPDYHMTENEIKYTMGQVEDFHQYLLDLEISIIELKLDWREMHRYCLRYSLETPDAAHVLMAKRFSQFLVTIDTALRKAGVSEIKIVDPGNFITKSDLFSAK